MAVIGTPFEGGAAPSGGAGPVPDAPTASVARAALAAYEHNLLLYRRTWRGSIFGNFALPVLFLVSMGIGLGSFVDRGAGTTALGGVSYLQFLAPALLVSTVMQGSVFEATFPILAGFHWVKRFHAMVATPLSPVAIALGQLGWMATRATLVASIFALVSVLFGAAATPGLVLAVPVATLTALTFAAPIAAYMATQRDVQAFNNIWRFGITPLFLFSGTFFPIEQLPEAIRPLAWLLPLWHGVDLARALALGTVAANPALHLAHLAILLGVTATGVAAVLRNFRRRLAR